MATQMCEAMNVSEVFVKQDTYFWNNGRGNLHLDIHDTTINTDLI